MDEDISKYSEKDEDNLKKPEVIALNSLEGDISRMKNFNSVSTTPKEEPENFLIQKNSE